MAREGLMDDSGYHGFDECVYFESCTSEVYDEAYEQGYADALDYAIKIALERTPCFIYAVELERLKK